MDVHRRVQVGLNGDHISAVRFIDTLYGVRLPVSPEEEGSKLSQKASTNMK